MTSIMILGGPKRDGKCHDPHEGYTCAYEYGHKGLHGTWRLGVGTISWPETKEVTGD